MRAMAHRSGWALALALAGCSPGERGGAGEGAGKGGPAAARGEAGVGAAGAGKVEAVAAASGKATARPVFIPAQEGDVAARVLDELGRGEGPLVVYVGAPWCEPCVAFHDAAVAGQFDATLAGVRFLEFNLDRDKDRLAAAGYTSRYIPLFALPAPDGRASGTQAEGGIKGPGAAQYVAGRLVPLLEAARKSP